MANQEDLEKLFEAALHEKQAPSRYGTPESMRKNAPAAFTRPVPGDAAQGEVSAFRPAPSAFQPAPSAFQPAPSTFQPAPSAFQPAPSAFQPAPSAFQAAPSSFQAAPSAFQAAAPVPTVTRDAQAEASLDSSINAELAAIMDEKVAKEKRRRKRGFLMTILFFVGVTGGATGWVVSNPERFEALKLAIAEIKSVGDVQGMVAKYQKALDKIAVRGKQIDAATAAMGIDPTSVDEHADPGFDKEMQAMMGENGGKTTAARDKLLREKFKSVQETGSLMPNKKEGENKVPEKPAVAE